MELPANIKTIFEDDYILVINKPPGILVVPTQKNEKYTLTGILKKYPCHRLDRETSGLIVYAKMRNIQEKMADAFRQRKVKKRYIGFAQGLLKIKKGAIKKRIEGQEALTYYRVCREIRRSTEDGIKTGFSILEISPVTGRTNQIRIHLKSIGHPLVGERKFAFGKDYPLRFRRCALHAEYLEFEHPVSGKRIFFRAKLPDDMQKFLSS